MRKLDPLLFLRPKLEITAVVSALPPPLRSGSAVGTLSPTAAVTSAGLRRETLRAVSETAHPYDITTQLAAAPSLETSNRLLLQSRTARLRPASDRRCILQQNSASAVLSVVAALSSPCLSSAR